MGLDLRVKQVFLRGPTMLLDVAGMHGNPGGAVHMFGRKFLSCTRVVQGTVCSRNWSSGSVKDFFLVV